MGFDARVLRVMIASPSDTVAERDAVERAIYSWNANYAHRRGVMLQPWRWESDSVPVMGGGPQQIINKQGVDSSDIVIALFSGRLGSPTAEAVSGTVEELERAITQGKAVHLFFSTQPLPNDVDMAQLVGLREFKSQASERGLLGDYGSVDELNAKVWQAIEHDLEALTSIGTAEASVSPTARLIVQPGHARELSGTTKGGAPRYRNRRWLDVRNEGPADAEEFLLTPNTEQSGYMLFADGPTVIHAGQSRRFSAERMMSGGDAPTVLATWKVNGEVQEKLFHVD